MNECSRYIEVRGPHAANKQVSGVYAKYYENNQVVYRGGRQVWKRVWHMNYKPTRYLYLGYIYSDSNELGWIISDEVEFKKNRNDGMNASKLYNENSICPYDYGWKVYLNGKWTETAGTYVRPITGKTTKIN